MSWFNCFCLSKSFEPPDVTEIEMRHSSLAALPDDISIYNRSVVKMDLSCNQIQQLPGWLCSFMELRELNLSENSLVIIPIGFHELTHLEKLDLSKNNLGEVDILKHSRSLVELNISNNSLLTTPEFYASLTNLQHLYMNDISLGLVHNDIGRLSKLADFEIRDNMVQDLPSSMAKLGHLTRIDLGMNDLKSMPNVIGSLTNLKELWIDGNKIPHVGKIIGQLTKLICLDMSLNCIQEVDEAIDGCSQLEELSLSINNLERLPVTLGNLHRLTILRLDCNLLGVLPDEIGQLRSLEELQLSKNHLVQLPSSIGLLKKLRTLYADGNQLINLPAQLGDCSSLSLLSCNENYLCNLPIELGNLKSLKVLSLNGNQLTDLPATLLSIPNLVAVWLIETQEKALPDFAEETHPETLMKILRCSYLPQPSQSELMAARQSEEEEGEELLRPRSAPVIRFRTHDEQIPQVESKATKRGLLRAPTPYPKELRKMQKQASNVRLLRELNGEIPNSDEPQYEDELAPIPQRPDEFVRKLSGIRTNPNIGYPPRPSSRSSDEPQIFDHLLTPIDDLNIRGQDSNVQNIHELLDEAAGGVDPGMVTDLPKVPPPYHVAKRRAAFFRSSANNSLNNSTPLSPSRDSEMIDGSMSGMNVSSSSPYTISSRTPGQYPPYSLNDSVGIISQQQLNEALNIGHVLRPSESYFPSMTYHQPTAPYQPPSTYQPSGMYSTNVLPGYQVQSSGIGPILKELDEVSGISPFSKSTGQSKIPALPLTPPAQHPPMNSDLSSRIHVSPSKDSPFAPVLSPRDDVLNRTYILERSEIHRSDNGEFFEPYLVDEEVDEDITMVSERLENEDVVDSRELTSQDVSEENETKRGPEVHSFTQTMSEKNEKGEKGVSQLDQASSRIPTKSRLPLFQNKKIEQVAKVQMPSKIHVNDAEPIVGKTGIRKPKAYGITAAPVAEKAWKRPEYLGPKPDILPKPDIGGLKPGVNGPTPNMINDRAPIAYFVPLESKIQKPLESVSARPIISQNVTSSRIPRFGESGKLRETPPPPNEDDAIKLVDSPQNVITVVPSPNHSPSNTMANSNHVSPNNNLSPSKIPTLGKKPWIFGTHKNAHVVPVDHIKTNGLGFTITEGGPNEAPGIFIDSVESEEMNVKLGDKILQVDGIDVAGMNSEIVSKILGNCSESLLILVSRLPSQM